MRDEVDKLFAKLKKVPTPSDLDEKIMAAVFNRSYQRLKYAAYSGIMASLALIIWSINIFITQLGRSPILTYMKMLFSDFGAVRGSLADWSMAMAESLSLDSLLLTLLGLFILITLINKLLSLRKQEHRGPKHWPGHISQGILG